MATKKQDDKVCFKGDEEKGPLIIKELERLGGVKSKDLSGIGINCYYYINKDKEITFDTFIPKGYTLKSIEDIVRTSEEPLLEVGKWYKGKDISTEDLIYTKFHSLGKGDNPTFLGSEHIYVKNKRLSKPGSPTWCFYLKDMGGLVDISEIQEYLPENHPDKIITKTTETDGLEKSHVEKAPTEKVKPKVVLLKSSKKASLFSKIERIHDKKSKV